MRIFILNLHGLVKGSGLEIGRDADNGGQTKYVLELAEYLSKREEVTHVHLFTRKIKDELVSKEYGATVEEINPKFDIRRIEFGGLEYKMKEDLWDHLDEFVKNAIKHIADNDIKPDWLHSHYGDAGYAATQISVKLNVPFAHTGHSLGLAKKQKMLASGMTEEQAEEKFKFSKRIKAEEGVLALSEFIVNSTYLEIADWEQYNNYDKAQFHVQPPGIDIEKFTPYYIKRFQEEEDYLQLQRRYWVGQNIEKFLTNPNKPIILALSRPDRRKNLHFLIEAYGEDKELQALANLVIFAGIRKDINTMPKQEKEVLTELLLLMDKYDLYGKMAIPKRHDIENEVALIYQYCANKRGTFANICLHENFGLTTIEAGGTGLPVVITKNGGPSEIVPRMKNGLLVDPMDKDDITRSLRKILTNEEQWRKFSDNGIINTRKHYSWDSHIEVYVSWVQESLSRQEAKTAKELNAPKANIKHLRESKGLIITDIDGTLIAPEHGDPGIIELKHFLQNRPPGISFALSSGRNFDLVKEVVDDYNLKVDFIVCSVGTEIYYDTNLDSKDEDWSAYLNFKWDREKIVNDLKTLPWMELQEENAQNPHKISYYCDSEKYNEEKIKNRLQNDWYHVNVVSSHNRFVDILPKRASKGNAILYLCHKWGLQLNKVFACGDSGNDMDMFREPINGIVVGNASDELSHLKTRKKLYVAKKFAAAGILEGLEYYNLR
ncbi:MAG: HAD-IIB family hydrolase [Flavobacteriales bacterium]|nr:HAD-IIB family hydrolase [Flavobacteriales bacterium]